jgi:hypothetical protein
MDILEKAKSHFYVKRDTLKEIPVPEWETTLYVRPLTLAESQKIQQSVKEDNVVDALITTLIVRARNPEGQPVFKLAQKPEILHSVDPDVVCRIVTEMNKLEDDYETLEKKSPPHPIG